MVNNIFTLLFVCTGNTCRSPMAEGIMKELIMDEYDRTGVSIPIKVISAGIDAYNGFMPSENAVKTASYYGIDISQYRSQPAVKEIIQEANLILTMERFHSEFIKQKFPYKENVYNLKNYLKENSGSDNNDIHDPAGMGLKYYMVTFKEIKNELERVAPHIFGIARKNNEEYE